jgi:hypothetical protein
MTQSKKSEDTFTINLDDTYGTTTTYWAGGIMTDTITITGNTPDTYIIDDSIGVSNYNITWPLDNTIDPDEIERMCKEYPALEKTWRNFKATYDLVKQDWKGKQDDEDQLPF